MSEVCTELGKDGIYRRYKVTMSYCYGLVRKRYMYSHNNRDWIRRLKDVPKKDYVG